VLSEDALLCIFPLHPHVSIGFGNKASKENFAVVWHPIHATPGITNTKQTKYQLICQVEKCAENNTLNHHLSNN